MDRQVYRQLLAQARRLTRDAEEARDAVQETLLAALQAGRGEPAWLAGVLRNQAAMLARGSGRRRLREAMAAVHEDLQPLEPEPDPTAPLRALPPAARRVAVLALHGLGAEEIRWILGLTPTAFRQRLTSIRKSLAALPREQRAESMALAYLRDPARSVPLQFGLVRRALKAALRGEALGTHDPDGHLLVVRRAHNPALRGNRQGDQSTGDSQC